mgnify:CR=1 FL=1|jgi:hypothetical protein
MRQQKNERCHHCHVPRVKVVRGGHPVGTSTLYDHFHSLKIPSTSVVTFIKRVGRASFQIVVCRHTCGPKPMPSKAHVVIKLYMLNGSCANRPTVQQLERQAASIQEQSTVNVGERRNGKKLTKEAVSSQPVE